MLDVLGVYENAPQHHFKKRCLKLDSAVVGGTRSFVEVLVKSGANFASKATIQTVVEPIDFIKGKPLAIRRERGSIVDFHRVALSGRKVINVEVSPVNGDVADGETVLLRKFDFCLNTSAVGPTGET